MKRHIMITYEWDLVLTRSISQLRHIEQLDAYAEGKAMEGITEGKTNGVLALSIGGTIYTGRWKATKTPAYESQNPER